jgi:succinylglutamate desuccinylase
MILTLERRLICQFSDDPDGPILVCIGGLHGNEPSGVVALHNVVEEIRRSRTRLQGQFWSVVGNVTALAAGRRFLDEDLNRIWSSERVQWVRTKPVSEGVDAEVSEQLQLLAVIDRVFQNAEGRRNVFFLDLHTTSARSGPFTIFGDTLSNRHFAEHFPVPMILGLEEQIEGALMDYVGNRGAITLGFEAGRHESPESVDRHEAAVWIALTASGVVSVEDAHNLAEYHRKLSDCSPELPRVLEVSYRHAVAPNDEFAMVLKFNNFEGIRKGQKVARDKYGDILAPSTGRILLPLYQAQGSDGFFVVRSVWPFWLKLSRFLRRLHLDSAIHLLPGVQTHPAQEGAFLVDAALARWRTVEIFHLLGFRRCRPEGHKLVFSRRSEPGVNSTVRREGRRIGTHSGRTDC